MEEPTIKIKIKSKNKIFFTNGYTTVTIIKCPKTKKHTVIIFHEFCIGNTTNKSLKKAFWNSEQQIFKDKGYSIFIDKVATILQILESN